MEMSRLTRDGTAETVSRDQFFQARTGTGKKKLSMEMSRLTRDGTAETVSRDQIFQARRGTGKYSFSLHFSCSADHVQDWQPYPVDPYSCYMRDHTYINIYLLRYSNTRATIYLQTEELLLLLIL